MFKKDTFETNILINCRICKKFTTKDPNKMIHHCINCHNGEFIKCSKCNFRCFLKKDLLEHNFRCHLNK